MRQTLHRFIRTTTGRGLVDITGPIIRWVASQHVATGLLTVFCRHTSASLIIQEKADPTAQADLERFFERVAPEGYDDGHRLEGPDDMPAHLRAALTPTSLSIPVEDGRPLFGTWQGFCLFEPRAEAHRREIVLHRLAG